MFGGKGLPMEKRSDAKQDESTLSPMSPLRRCLTPVAMRFFSKKTMVMGHSKYSVHLYHFIPANVNCRKCLTLMK